MAAPRTELHGFAVSRPQAGEHSADTRPPQPSPFSPPSQSPSPAVSASPSSQRPAYLYRFDLLGGLRIFGPAGVVVTPRFRTHNGGELAVYLAYHRGRRFTREVLADKFWPNAATSQKGRGSLSTELTSLRGLLEPAGIPPGSVVIADSKTVGFASERITTDVARFEELLDQAAALGTTNVPAASDLREQALALWPNPETAVLLSGYYDDWIASEQERLRNKWLEAALWIAKNNPERTQFFAQRALAVEPELAEARRLLERRASVPPTPTSDEREIRVVVSPPTVTLVSQAQSFALTATTPPTTQIPSELPPSQTPLAASPPPLAEPVTLAPPALTRPLTRFFGRTAEMEDLQYRLRDPLQRLITLVGPGGAGKTRLAREMAASEADAEHVGGVLPSSSLLFFGVDLTGLEDPNLLTERIATAIGAASGGDPYERIANRLAVVRRDEASGERRRPGLLLDNFEPILPEGAYHLETILARTPELACLVTSRVELGVDGEQVVRIDPLPLPPATATASVTNAPSSANPDRLAALTRLYPSLELFVDRARLVKTDFRLTQGNVASIVRLVRDLEGMPLAIELAAARVLVMSPEQLATSLPGRRMELLKHRGKNVHDRHRSLRATIAWSVDLLSPSLQAFFAALSVFRGGWTGEAATALSAKPIIVDGEKLSALDALEELCRTSLVRSEYLIDRERGEWVRFSFLESIREYASELLESGEVDALSSIEAHRLHVGFYLGLSEKAEKSLREGDRTLWVERLKTDHDNLISALNWSDEMLATQNAELKSQAAKAIIGLTSSLRSYWTMHGALPIARQVLDRTLSRACRRAAIPISDPGLLRRAVNTSGILAITQGDTDQASRRFRQALWFTRHDDTKSGLRARAGIMNNLAIVADDRQRPAESRRWYDASLALWQKLGESRYQLFIRANLGIWEASYGDLDESEAQFNIALVMAREMNLQQTEGFALRGLGEVHHRRGILNPSREQEEFSEAARLYRQSIKALYSTGDRIGCATALYCLGLLTASLNDERRAEWIMMSGCATLKHEGACPAKHQFDLLEEDAFRRAPQLATLSNNSVLTSASTLRDCLSLDDAVQRILIENVYKPILGNSVL